MERVFAHSTIPCPPPDFDDEEASPESDRLPVERVFIPREGDDGND
jgi:hypothetical protein